MRDIEIKFYDHTTEFAAAWPLWHRAYLEINGENLNHLATTPSGTLSSALETRVIASLTSGRLTKLLWHGLTPWALIQYTPLNIETIYGHLLYTDPSQRGNGYITALLNSFRGLRTILCETSDTKPPTWFKANAKGMIELNKRADSTHTLWSIAIDGPSDKVL